MSILKAKAVHMGAAQCAVDLGDGSERGEYVNQDYILQKLGRPHRAVSLMYCYYPNDKEWPQRISEACKDMEINFAWDYPYDNYFTYKGGINGTKDDEPFTYMRDVRRHGQDVLLTMTIDPKLPDEYIVAIAHDLRTFGRVQLRINHEATGDWFSFNKRASYEEVAAFFVNACNIIHREAPNVKTIICLDGYKELDDEKMEKEDIFAEAARSADIVSVDRYMALHWGWPYDVAEEGGDTFARYTVDKIYNLAKKSCKRYAFLNNGVKKPMVLSEFNSDGDVTGPYDQVSMFHDFCEMLKSEKEKWLDGFTMYQFRDRGRLGLEIEDPNNPDVGIEQPLMEEYRKVIHEDFFSPVMEEGEDMVLPAKMRWGSSEDADGIAINLHFDSSPVFCEAYFDDNNVDMNLMLELNGHWFYKAPGVKCIDMMSAFFKKPLDGAKDMQLKIFAPPASGENDPLQGEDWQLNYYTELKSLPEIRIRYAPIVK